MLISATAGSIQTFRYTSSLFTFARGAAVGDEAASASALALALARLRRCTRRHVSISPVNVATCFQTGKDFHKASLLRLDVKEKRVKYNTGVTLDSAITTNISGGAAAAAAAVIIARH